ncbi:MAG: aminotransferase class I/II-fold pyridoxal phosphate-dependent enzyme [Veillonella sp.]|nr:aminotransferase class I/II-fold pyridoxal phosphate-dependent enzyme [Veillonella sp.]
MPYVELLESYKRESFVPFHTPGHKIGHGAPQRLIDWMGPALPYDLGVMYALDDLHEPEGAFKEAQELAADLYGADAAWYSINGTTALIMTMIMATVGEGETIIIPREAHRSVMSGLVMSGAKPVYLPSQFNEEWGLQLGATYQDVVATLDAHPEAKVILLVYPNYYGLGVDVEAIVAECHRRDLIVLVDEAHGPHLPFDKRLPIEAVEAGADLVASSTHKSVGSLTQTSTLFGQGNRIDYRRVTQVHQMFQSTSPNYIFMASLDMARHQLATEGEALVGKAVDLAYDLRHRLAQIPGIRVMDGQGLAKNFDPTKVLIDARDLGLDATDFERRLRAQHIEVELIQAHHVLVTITIGDSQESIDALVQAVKKVSQDVLANKESNADAVRINDSDRIPVMANDGDLSSVKTKEEPVDCESETVTSKSHPLANEAVGLPQPKVVLTPRQGFYAKKERVKLSEALGRLCGETITYYPPGIPFIGIGEEITQEVLDFIAYKQAAGFEPNGASDMSLETILVLED